MIPPPRVRPGGIVRGLAGMLLLLGFIVAPVDGAHGSSPDVPGPVPSPVDGAGAQLSPDPAAAATRSESPALGRTSPDVVRPGASPSPPLADPVATLAPVAWAESPIRPTLGGGFLTGVGAPTYQWFLDGVAVRGATAATFTPRESQAGQALSVLVSAVRDGGRAVYARSTSAVVTLQSFDTTPAPILGSARVGSSLTASVGAWSPRPARLSYQWMVDGTPVAGATAASFTPRAAQLGGSLTFEITATRPGFISAAATSAPVVIAEGRLSASPRVTVSGNRTPGSTLRAAVSGLPGGSTVLYQWQRNGSDIDGATHSTYVIDPLDVGRQITVVISIAVPGYQAPGPRTSSPVTATGRAYANCTALRVDYPHGVMRVGATDMVSGSPRAPHPDTFVSTALYLLNTTSDRDKDGIACEA